MFEMDATHRLDIHLKEGSLRLFLESSELKDYCTFLSAAIEYNRLGSNGYLTEEQVVDLCNFLLEQLGIDERVKHRPVEPVKLEYYVG